jgi:predicted nucleic acid-binding protein
VKVYVDTNILVSDAIDGRVHQANAAQLFLEIKARRWTPVISAHGMAEVYSVLTRTPYPTRVTAAIAWQVLEENVLKSFEIETLSRSEYIRTIKECASQGWSGRRIYDALHIAAARKAACSRIYTFNVSHFRQLAPDLTDRIMAP